MTRLIASSLLSACLLLTACSNIAGQWEATGDMGDFQLARTTFNKDKTYEAVGEYGGQVRTSTGHYTFNGMRLTLTPDHGGPARHYDASLGMSGKTLTVKHQSGSEKVSVDMKKVGCPQDCTGACCNPS